ncbi:MAG TPA: iron ABC transporter substrate-binding protein [Blastococcus sp.]
MNRSGRAIATILSAVGVAGALAACGGSGGAAAESGGSEPVTLTLYNAQHEDLMKAVVEGFTEKSGIKVEFRSGDDSELANQIVQEGKASPADVFVTENSPSVQVVADAGLFAPLDKDTLAQVPDKYRPESGDWTGFAGRSTVLAYNPDLISEADLPASMMDLANPEWRGKVGFPPGGADFQAIVGAVLELRGEDATRTWLQGLADGKAVYQGNTAVMQAVNEGQIPVGIIYHYYWYKDQAESGAKTGHVKLHYFKNQDPGAFVSVSGAGVLASSKHPKEAQQFVNYLTSADGQRRLAESTALEYAVANGATSADVLPPLDTLDAPTVDPGALNGPKVIELMQKVGLL